MQVMNISELKPHPRNAEFFDDISGDSWDAFLESIKTSGVIEPIVITQDKVIVSGHQRIRACRELGKSEVMTEMRQYDSDDQVLKDLIETNIRQRGIGNTNPVKFGRCIKELERIYGIRNGATSFQGNQHTMVNTEVVSQIDKPPKSLSKSQEDLAEEIGLSVAALHRYKKLADLIPEVEDFLDTGMITMSTALAISRQLSVDDQVKLVSTLDNNSKHTAKEVQKQIDEIKKPNKKPEKSPEKPQKSPDDDYAKLKAENDTLRAEIETLKTKNETVNKTFNETVNETSNEKSPFNEDGTLKDEAKDEAKDEPKYDKQKEGLEKLVTESPQYKQLLEKYNTLLSQHDTDQNTINNKDADIQLLQLSMDEDTYNAALSNKILAAISRVDSVIKNELVPLVYNNDLEKISDVLGAKVEEALSNNIEIMKKCIMSLRTGKYIDTDFTAKNVEIIEDAEYIDVN